MSVQTSAARPPLVAVVSRRGFLAALRSRVRHDRIPLAREAAELGGALAAVGLVSMVLGGWFQVRDPTVAALALLLIVIVVAAAATLRVAMVTSVAAAVCFNFSFLDPVGTFVIADDRDWFAFATLVVASVLVSRLSDRARSRAAEATARGDELERLLTLTRRLFDEHRQSESARHSAELKATLLASLGHDLRTPLAALVVAAGNLTLPGLDATTRQSQAALIRTEAARLQRLFDKLVDLARVETHAVVVDAQWVEPEALVADAVRALEDLADTRPLRVSSDPPAASVRLDPRLTRTALSHVLENATQYAPPGSGIEVSLGVRGNHLLLEVRDHGPGLSAADLGCVFEAGYRGRAAPRVGGGMGLAIARGLIAAQGGEVRVANHPDGGAVFTLTVPVEVRILPRVEVEEEAVR